MKKQPAVLWRTIFLTLGVATVLYAADAPTPPINFPPRQGTISDYYPGPSGSPDRLLF